jgi:putrescine transport system substrate-binding protein
MNVKTALLLALTVLAAACGKQAAEPATSGAAPAAPAPEAKVLNVYNWSDYIAEDTVPNFEKQTGIKVTYDVFDSNEVLEAKLLAGTTGYDIVVPSLNFLGRQIKAGVFMPIDKSKLSNYKNLDPKLMALIATLDPGNEYGVPYMWGTVGIGYNTKKVKEALGADAPTDSWALVFDPKYASKLKSCGLTMLDSPTDILSAALKYMGADPNTNDEATIQKAADLVMKVRPYITYFHSSQYINDLANGDVCVSVGWSGDVFQAKSRAEDAKNGVELAYSIPKEGAQLWFDMMAIPKDAKHPENALAFLNYLLEPKVIAADSDYIAYANANAEATQYVDPEIRNNPAIYPPQDVMDKLFLLQVLPPDVDRVYTRAWTTIKTGK